MKAKLIFDMEDPCDRENFLKVNKTHQAFRALEEIRERIFRPARKHGYGGPGQLSSMIDDESVSKTEVISLLEEEFNRILNELDLKEFDI